MTVTSQFVKINPSPRLGLSNTKATFEAQFMKKLSNIKAELKKGVAYKLSVY